MKNEVYVVYTNSCRVIENENANLWIGEHAVGIGNRRSKRRITSWQGWGLVGCVMSGCVALERNDEVPARRNMATFFTEEITCDEIIVPPQPHDQEGAGWKRYCVDDDARKPYKKQPQQDR